MTIIIQMKDGTIRRIQPTECENVLKLVEAITSSNLKEGIKKWESYEATE